MAGYIPNIINIIIKNLRDEYQFKDGFPVLKELIQNADDSKAKRFIFGDHSGFPDSNYSLMQGPGLWFFNDGEFKPSDKRAIRSFGENSKAGESGTIGKFGLGMKSVFHLCEAFYYLAYDGSKYHCVLMNPWDKGDDGNKHSDWLEPDIDTQQKLQSVVDTHVKDAKTWFLLWVPLRQKRHLQKPNNHQVGAILDRFPGDNYKQDLNFLAESELPNRLAILLPLLPRLEQIEFIPSFSDWTSFYITIETKGRLHTADEQEISSVGKVVMNPSNQSLFSFAGKKYQDGESLFKEFKHQSNWPKTYCWDEYGEEMPANDKSEPEGAVLIGHEDNQSGRLDLQWAVFLPLEDHGFECLIPDSSRRYRIVLHGQYSIDAGRRGIHEFQKLDIVDNSELNSLDEFSLRRRWNQEIAQRITLPLLLPSLADYVREHQVKDDEIKSLTYSLFHAISKAGEQTKFGERYRKYLCCDYDWVKMQSEKGSEWQLINNQQYRILPLPAVPLSDPNRPWRLLPGLRLLENVYFRDYDAPCFQRQSQQWQEQDWITVLDKGFVEAFSSSSGLDYLASLFGMTGDVAWLKIEAPQDLFSKGLKQGLLKSIETLKENRTKIQRVVDVLSQNKRIKIGPVETDAKTNIPNKLWQLLWRCETKILPLPSYLDVQFNPASGKPTPEDVLKWLSALQKEMDGKLAESALQVSTELLKSLDEQQRNTLIRHNPTLKIVPAREPRHRKMIAASFSELELAKQRGNLFASVGDIRDPEGLTRLLANVLPDEVILLLTAENRKVVFPNVTLPFANDQKAILAALVNGVPVKILGDIDARIRLMEYANKSENDSQARLGLRYLLHGDAKNYKDATTPLWIRGNGQSLAWEKLWRQACTVEDNSEWNVLQSRLADALRVSRSEWLALKIQEITPAEVINTLPDKIDHIHGQAFTLKERIELLCSIDDRDLWRNLPLHTLENGDIAAISANTYLAGIELHKALVSQVQIVAKSEDANLLQKQILYLDILDYKAVAKIALDTESPVDFWELLLEASTNITDFGCENALTFSYRKKKWLPLHNGQTVAPQDVIDNEFLADDIQRLSSLGGYCYCGVNDLDADVINHAHFQFLRTFFAFSAKDVLQSLGLLLEMALGYAIGKIAPDNTDKLKQAASVLRKYRKLPGWSIIYNAIDAFGPEACLNYLIPQANRSIDSIHVFNVLEWLADKNTTNTIQTHYLYLSLLVNENNDIEQILPNLSLRSCSGNWKKAIDLCYEADGVDLDYLLDERQAVCLRSFIKNGNAIINATKKNDFEIPKISTIHETQEIIDNYFAPWSGLVRSELIGALLLFLGTSVRDIANKYLYPHSFDSISELIDWQDPEKNSYESQEGMSSAAVKATLDTLNTLIVKTITFEKGNEKVYAQNLLGDIICVPLKEIPETLIVGNMVRGIDYLTISLRVIDPEEYMPETLIELLRFTAERIFQFSYKQPGCNLQSLWKELNQSKQLEIDIVRDMILDQLDLYLRQLGVYREPIFKSTIDELKASRNRLTAAKRKNNNLKDIEQELFRKREQLANLLITDKYAQECVLKKMRNKLEDYQYKTDGIIFELFQNADDASIELGRFENNTDEDIVNIPKAAQRFIVLVDDNIVRTFHWGRLVNYRDPHDTTNQCSGYGEDLEKMLILSASDKSEDEAVTGRFGLGFKSVFLVSNNPRILSGDLRVQIVGGILPEPWIDANTTAKVLDAYKLGRRYPGTAIELPLLEDLNGSMLVNRFQALANLQCIFARAIRHIEINTEKFEWTPDEIFPGVEIGSVSTMGKDSLWLVFRLKNFTTIAIPLTARGLQSISKEIPSLWVTAPTRVEDSFGFVVSAPFNIDAGRGQLAGNNQNIAHQVGTAFGWKLAELAKEFESDWPKWRQQFVWSEDMMPGEFWASLWKTLSDGWLNRLSLEGGYALGRTIAITAIRVLYEQTKHIPTGLPNPFANWVSRDSVRYKASESWTRPQTLRALENWKLFAQKMNGGFIVSDKITDVLQEIHPQFTISTLDIDGLLNLLDDLRCDSCSAKSLESILQSLPEQTAQSGVAISSSFSIQLSLSKLRFQSRAKDWKASRYLLLKDTDDTEESLRAAFATDGYLLSTDYDPAAISFFLRSRPRFEADTDRMTEWAFIANHTDTQNAVLRYILNGELGGKLAEAMRNNLAGTWLEGISLEHLALKSWGAQDREKLLRLLTSDAIQRQMQQEFFSKMSQSEPEQRYEPQALERIAEWWEREGRLNYLPEYLNQLYPRGELPNIQFDEDGRIDRAGWMMLLSIGVFQRLGRIHDFQTRGFIEMLEQQGWWQTFCDIDPSENGEEWLDVLRQFAEDQIDDEAYSHWLDCFPRLFKLASRLEDYAFLFERIEKRSIVVQEQLLTPNFDPILQGSGIDLPPIVRTLRKGFNLVMRELLRLGVLTNAAAVPHAYMPTQKLLKLLESLNVELTEATSVGIHTGLCEILGDEGARFGGDYDIPLQILAKSGNSDLIWDICQVEFEDSDEEEQYYG